MPAEQSLVAQWNEVMLAAIRADEAKPTETTYQLYLTSAAIYDAWAAYDTTAYGQYSELSRPEAEHDAAHKAEAVSHAAYNMLSHLFPNEQARFDAFMDQLGYDRTDTSTDPSTAAGVGNLAAQNVRDARAQDGSNAANDYADTSGYVPVNSADPDDPATPGQPGFDPNHWQPLRVPTGTVVDENGIPVIDPNDPSSYDDQVALTPHWGGIDPFALTSGGQFRPDAPPKLGDFTPYTDGTGKVTTNDQAWRDQVTEVLHTSASLTNTEKVMAEFWADGPRTESPPGHWNQIAQDIALREGHGIDEDAKMFFALNAAVFDAGIATWDAKYHYDFIRPQSAIRHLFHGQQVMAWAGPDKGTQAIMGEDWQPYQNVTFVTPPFPEFVSGHSSFSMAAARTIAAFVGSDTFYDGTSLGNYDLDDVPGTDLLGQYVATHLVFETWEGTEPVVLQWETLTEAAEEAGISRLYGGIHIQDGNLRALDLGEDVAAQAQIRWSALFTRGGDDVLTCDAAGGLMIAGAGNDSVQGNVGDDIVEGGTGNDLLTGMRGADRLDGGAGLDDLSGGLDDDILTGGAGDDVLRGGPGDDLLDGGAGDDALRGGVGDDELCGGDGLDVLRGGAGNDVLKGGRDSDDLGGTEGNNVLIGGEGWDILRGGLGADKFVFNVDDGGGVDEIWRFDASQDQIVLQGFADGTAVQTLAFQDAVSVFVDGVHIANVNRIDPGELVVGDTIVFDDTPLV
ncbi:DUF6851 domain-containing protein [Sedimentitalea sp. HM32M-2]|uniref:DUF6851 domain-containing protein n=1 Tax=Sedimentitalea sp. HM32M-2 TaxID=3351566 RepID=UPI00362E0057